MFVARSTVITTQWLTIIELKFVHTHDLLYRVVAKIITAYVHGKLPMPQIDTNKMHFQLYNRPIPKLRNCHGNSFPPFSLGPCQ